MKQNLKERVNGKNGITLIALVITIIVLLILAGVTIATLTGDNGILTKAQSAKKVSTDAEIEEKIKLAVIASKINESNTVDTDVLTKELNNQFVDDGWEKTEIDANTWKVTVNGQSYKIDLTTGTIEKVTGIIVSSNPSKVLAGKTVTITATLEEIDKTGDISFTVGGVSATISNVNQTENGATATVTIAEDATGNIEIEGKLDEEHKSKCTIKVIQDVTKAVVDSNLANVEIESTLNIASCITNKESIEEFTITNVTGNATKENDKTIKGTGTSDGTATVTITGETTGKTKDITIAVKKAEVLGVGSYVNYSVDYDNVATYNGTYIPKDEYAGKWRILDLGAHNSDGTYGTDENPVRIVSAGVPLSYYHYNNSSTSVTNLTTGFFSTPINTETKTNYNYYKCGFKNGSTALTDINDVKNLFNNNLTAKNGETPKVQAMTKADLDKVYDPTETSTTSGGTYVKDAKFDNMLAIPSKDKSEYYAYYWLASDIGNVSLWFVLYNGYVDSYHDYTCGVRPVVTLVPNISITKGTNGAWNLSSNNNQN